LRRLFSFRPASLLSLELFVFVASELRFSQNAVNNRHEKERGERGEEQDSNDRAADRRVLLAPTTETE